MDKLSEYEWSEIFWPNFIQEYWEKHPTSFDYPAVKSFIDLEELFEIVTHMPRRELADRFWIARTLSPKSRQDFVMGNLDLIGPQPSDVNFSGYFKRLRRYKTGINIHNLDRVKPDLWNRIQSMIKSLGVETGRPSIQRWDIDTFFGTYCATPFGIHKDSASVFSLVLMGERTYCTWESDYFKQSDSVLHTPDLDKIRPHLRHAEIFKIKPGRIFYWPSNRWHVVMSDGTPSVAAQISAYFSS